GWRARHPRSNGGDADTPLTQARPLRGHLATPGPGLALAGLDELLKALQVVVHPARDAADRVAHVLHHALRVVLDLQHHAGLLIGEAVEGDHARVLRARRALPRHTLVGPLLGDLGGPVLLLAADVGVPAQSPIIQLGDRGDALHEARELLELGPLVVRGAYRHFDVDGFLDDSHGLLLSFQWHGFNMERTQAMCHWRTALARGVPRPVPEARRGRMEAVRRSYCVDPNRRAIRTPASRRPPPGRGRGPSARRRR